MPRSSPPSPPLATRRPVTRTLHGRELVDDFAWLAVRGDAEARAYLEAENAYAERALAHLADLEETLYREAVGRIKETDLSVPVRLDDWLYYRRTEKGRQYPIYCRKRRGPEAPESVLLDVNDLAEGREYLRVGALEVSPSHGLMAVCVDVSGGEAFELRVRDLASGDWLPDRIGGLSGSIAWAHDDRTLFYTLLDAAKRPYKVRRHTLGEDDADPVVYREDDEAFFVSVERTRSRRCVLITSASAVTSEVRWLPADQPEAAPRMIEPRRPGVEYYVDHRADAFYLLVNSDPAGARAENFRLVRRPMTGAAADDVELLAHRPDVKLENVDLFSRHMVVWQRREGLLELRIHAFGTAPEEPPGELPEGTEAPGEPRGPSAPAPSTERLGEGRGVELPEPVYTLRRESNPEFETTELRFGYTSMVTPSTVYSCDLDSLELAVLKIQEVLGGYEAERYVTGRLRVESDGVSVPVTYVHRRDLALDGSAPCLLHGYGAYGMVIDPVFSPVLVSLLDRGFVYAVAHVRGGGIFGKAWHEDGRMLAKKHSFEDLIAVAEHLIAAGYTNADRLAVRGGSAGGLLVGAVLNMRPDLFAAAIARVPFVDVVNTMLDPSIPLTVIEYEEWGNPQDERYFEYMLSYSPYDNVEAKAYPAMLVTAGLNDPRVQYWEPAKWMAKLRALRTDDNLAVLRTHMGAGHAGPSGRYDVLRERAQEYAFLLDALGLAG
jgi:oligopeptidase B